MKALVFAWPLLSFGCISVYSGDDSSDQSMTENDCANRVDDDSDGRVDCADTDCASSSSCQSANKELICADQVDNDHDGHVDCDDTDCMAELACYEVPDDQFDFMDGPGLSSLDIALVKPRFLADTVQLDVDTYGAFPPSDLVYQWGVRVDLYVGTSGPPSAEITTGRFDGDRDIDAIGVSPFDVAVTDYGEGVVIELSHTPPEIDHFSVGSFVRVTTDDPLETDRLGNDLPYPLPPR